MVLEVPSEQLKSSRGVFVGLMFGCCSEVSVTYIARISCVFSFASCVEPAMIMTGHDCILLGMSATCV